jgi:SsrA-binding protein
MRFSIQETFDAGMELFGYEVKSLRAKLGKLDGARVLVRGGEAFVSGMSIPPFQPANTPGDYDPLRTRRLLLSKKEIALLADAESRKGLTTVPLEVYNMGRYLKLKVAIVGGKGKADKREDIKRREAEREVARVLKRK